MLIYLIKFIELFDFICYNYVITLKFLGVFMYFKNIYFHNVAYMPIDENGFYRLSRLPLKVVSQNEGSAYLSAGVELRFKPIGDVTINLYCYDEICENIEVYFGSFNSGISIPVQQGYNTVTVSASQITKLYTDKEIKSYTPFSSKIVRVILPTANFAFVSASGTYSIPSKAEMPKTTILFYGSKVLGNYYSKTTASFPFILSQKLDADYINLGFDLKDVNPETVAPYVKFLDYNYAVIEGADESVFTSDFKYYYKLFKKFASVTSKNKKRKHLFIPTTYVLEGKNKKITSNVKKLTKGFKRYQTITPLENVSSKDIILSSGEYTPTAYIDLINALYAELDNIVPVYTIKDKKRAKPKNKQIFMDENSEPQLSLKASKKITDYVITEAPVETQEVVVEPTPTVAVETVAEPTITATETAKTTTLKPKEINALRKRLIKNAKAIHDEVLSSALENIDDEEIVEYAKFKNLI